jgi:chitodextrinase
MRKVDFATWGVFPYVANTTRNIQYKSANTGDHSRKGHVMFMHNPDVDVRYAGFYDLGRTRKDIPVTDSETASLPTGDNPRGKYPLHFHRTGHKNASLAPAYVVGCAVVNSPGWGYVNHDSYVNFEDNVSYNVSGAHYVLENGAERGAFRRNIAIRAPGGSNRHIKEGTTNHDLAHGGEGFWFQGGNYIAENNVASGCLDGGFTWFARSNGTHNGSDNQFVPANLLLDPAQAGGRPGYGSSDLPIMSHKNNTSLGCYYGMITIDVEINGTGPTNSVIENFVTLNARAYSGIVLEYYRNFTFRNSKVLRDNDWPWNQWEAAVGIQAHNLIDHLYPFQTRSADRAIGLVIRNYGVGVKNFESAVNDDRGEATGMAKWQVIGAAVDHNCPNGAFNNTGTYNGVPLVQNIASEADVVPMPTFSPAAGTYASTQTVTIGTVTGATIYYVVGTQGWVSPSLESQLKTGSWTQYTGPVTISANRKLIAVAVRNGQYSRINSGFFTINASAPADTQAPTVPANLASTGKTTTSVSLSWSASTDNVGVTGYDVYRGGTFAGSATSTSYTATGLSAATAYTFTVRAKDAAGNQSAASSGVTVTTDAGTAPTTATLTPVADTDTQSDVAAGTNTSLNASQWNTLFVKFNLSTIAGTVSSAKLRVYKNNTNTGTLNVNGASPDSWTEGGAKPTLGGAIATATMGGTAGYIEIDVTGTVNAEAAGDDLVTFGLTTNLGGWTGFNSRENAANKPQLVVTYGSGARLAAAGAEAGALRVFPNPASAGVVHVRYRAAAAGEATLLLTNALGRSAAKRTFAAVPGDNTVTLSTEGVAAGLYLITVQQGTTRRVTKVYLK